MWGTRELLGRFKLRATPIVPAPIWSAFTPVLTKDPVVANYHLMSNNTHGKWKQR